MSAAVKGLVDYLCVFVFLIPLSHLSIDTFIAYLG